MIKKFWELFRRPPRDARRSGGALHRLAPLAKPPANLLDRIDAHLDAQAARGHRRQLWAWCALPLVPGMVAIVAVATTSAPVRYVFSDAMGTTIAQLQITEGEVQMNVLLPVVVQVGVAHLWGFAADGTPVHISHLPVPSAEVPQHATAPKYAISLEADAQKRVRPAGPIVATSRPESYFLQFLHPISVRPTS